MSCLCSQGDVFGWFSSAKVECGDGVFQLKNTASTVASHISSAYKLYKSEAPLSGASFNEQSVTKETP